MLIMHSDKFRGILIVGGIEIKKILPKPVKLKIIWRVELCIRSARSRIEVEEESFLTPLYLPKSLGPRLVTFLIKVDL